MTLGTLTVSFGRLLSSETIAPARGVAVGLASDSVNSRRTSQMATVIEPYAVERVS